MEPDLAESMEVDTKEVAEKLKVAAAIGTETFGYDIGRNVIIADFVGAVVGELPFGKAR